MKQTLLTLILLRSIESHVVKVKAAVPTRGQLTPMLGLTGCCTFASDGSSHLRCRFQASLIYIQAQSHVHIEY